MTGLGSSAAAEWSALVATALVGTDRRTPPHPQPGWDTWSSSDDPAVQLLDRAAAVVAARRAGVVPFEAPGAVVPVAPSDRRPPCPDACARRLERILAGEHVLLVAEWLELLERRGWALPWEALPRLLLRGRRDPAVDRSVRRLARGRAEWLADLVPELGVSSRPSQTPRPAQLESAVEVPAVAADSRARAASIVAALVERRGSWTVVPQFEQLIVSLSPNDLASLCAALADLAFDVSTERTRTALLALAEFRLEMHREFDDGVEPRRSTSPTLSDLNGAS